MMVDDVLGAQQHTLFMVEFARPSRPGLAAKEHFHPFEEAYFILRGRTTGTLGGERYELQAGDCIWTGTGTSHGFVNTGEEPLRWLEVQAPAPPPSHAFFFDDDWRALEGPA
jgi:mannose-6-phosphate isomerase-like protein (cupin superfamily)